MCQNSVFANLGDVKNEVFEKKIAFFVFVFFYVGEIETEKRNTNKMEKAREKKTRIFVHTVCFGQKFFLDQNSANQEKL